MFKALANTNTLYRLNSFVQSPRIKAAGILAFDVLGLRHLVVRVDPVNACNLRCGMCYFSDEKWVADSGRGRLTDDDLSAVGEQIFPYAMQVHVGCSAEPTMFKNYEQIVKLAHDRRVPYIAFVTNGMLLKREKVEAMADWGLDEMTVSCHGVRRETYEALMTGAKHDVFLEKLEMVSDVKRRAGAGSFVLRINYTVNPDNLDELADFFEVYGAFAIDTLQVRPMMDMNGAYHQKKPRSLASVADRYAEVMEKVTREAKSRGVTVIGNLHDPSYSEEDDSASLYENFMLRFVRPGHIWRPDFDIAQETYRRDYARSGGRRELLRTVLRGKPKRAEFSAGRSRIVS